MFIFQTHIRKLLEDYGKSANDDYAALLAELPESDGTWLGGMKARLSTIKLGAQTMPVLWGSISSMVFNDDMVRLTELWKPANTERGEGKRSVCCVCHRAAGARNHH